METELPTMNSASYASNTYTGSIKQLTNDDQCMVVASSFTEPQRAHRVVDKRVADMLIDNRIEGMMRNTAPKHMENDMAKTTRRYVQIFIVDPDSRVPLDKSALYEGDSFLTDLTDQELFYELEIKSILADYNAYRITVQDKKASDKFGRDVLLEAAKIRDLSMTVVEIATF